MVLLETKLKIAVGGHFSVTIILSYQIVVLDCFVARNRVGMKAKRELGLATPSNS